MQKKKNRWFLHLKDVIMKFQSMRTKIKCKARLFYFQIYSRLDELKSLRKRVCAQTYYFFQGWWKLKALLLHKLLRYLKWSLFLLSLEVCSEIYQMQSFYVLLIVQCVLVDVYQFIDVVSSKCKTFNGRYLQAIQLLKILLEENRLSKRKW